MTKENFFKNLPEEISVIKILNSSWINITRCKVLCTKSPMKQKCYENDLPGIFPEIIHVNWSQMRLNEPRVNHSLLSHKNALKVIFERKVKNRVELPASAFFNVSGSIFVMGKFAVNTPIEKKNYNKLSLRNFPECDL